MALTNGPNLGLVENGNLGEAHFTELMRQWRGLDGLVQPRVISRALTSPPGSPANGDCYIPATGATGAWSGQAQKIARYASIGTASGWEFHTPRPGWTVWDIASNRRYVYNGSAWLWDGAGYFGCAAYRTTSQSIPTGTGLNVVTWQAATEIGANDWWASSPNPSRITVPAGVSLVVVTCGVFWAANSTGNRRARMWKNGVGFDRGFGDARQSVPAPLPTEINAVSAAIPVVPGDYIEMVVSQDSGVSLNVEASGSGTWMEVVALA